MSGRIQNLTNCRVLISGHLPPPMGGIAMFYQSLLTSSLSKKVDLYFVQTSSQKRTLANAGKASLSNLLSAVQDCARFLRAVIKHKPQITHIATAPGFSFLKHSVCVLIADLFGSRVLIHPHCSLSALYSDRPGWWRWFVRQILRRTDGLIALSREWEQISDIIPGHPVFLLPNAIHQDDYLAIAKERSKRSDLPVIINILYLGYLGKAKGTYDLIESAKLILSNRKDIVFHLVGDELAIGERAALQQRIATAGMDQNIRLHLPVDYPDKLEYYRQADVFVYPSYYEGMPMAVIEAMASGLPVIATKVGGLPDLVMDYENGLLTAPGDPEALSRALIILIDNADMRRSMQVRSSQLAAEKYDIEKLVDELIRIYSEFLPGTKQNRKQSIHEARGISNNGNHPNDL
ncbi:MAG: glycosyltransferase family 4 protein [Chloroflexi bacterium]|nr:glycosyltransferase family 4 protein [Chloroflexota bacterium]